MANVLKSRHFLEGVNTAQTEVYNWEDVAARAKMYLDTVREQAAKLLADARQEAETLRLQAASNGAAEGQQQIAGEAARLAQNMAQQQVRDAMKSIETLSVELQAGAEKWLRQWQHETVPLAIAIAEKLVARQIESDPEILLKWIQETIRLAQSTTNYRLRLHPQTIANLQPALDDIVAELSRTRSIALLEDPNVQLHGVVLDTQDGQIDMQLRSQLERLREELL